MPASQEAAAPRSCGIARNSPPRPPPLLTPYGTSPGSREMHRTEALRIATKLNLEVLPSIGDSNVSGVEGKALFDMVELETASSTLVAFQIVASMYCQGLNTSFARHVRLLPLLCDPFTWFCNLHCCPRLCVLMCGGSYQLATWYAGNVSTAQIDIRRSQQLETLNPIFLDP